LRIPRTIKHLQNGLRVPSVLGSIIASKNRFIPASTA